MFSSTSYFWPIILGLVGFGVVILVVVAAFAFALRRTSSATPAVPATPEPIAKQRLLAVLAQPDLHAADRVVVESVAAKLEPGPITREGQEAQLRAMIADMQTEKPA